MIVFDMAQACKPLEFDTNIIARMPDGTELPIVNSKIRINRETDQPELILELVASPTVTEVQK